MNKKTLLPISASLIVLVSLLQFHTSNAQINIRPKSHAGISVSFGSRSNKVSSNHTAIDNMKLMEVGGSVGVLWGNNIVETKLALGYYYSASSVAHTVDLINLESAIQFYPLQAITGKTHKINPYVSTGLTANQYKFYGFYAGNEGVINYSVSIEPYLGNVTSYFGSVGAGLEVNLLDQDDFVKLFAEVNYHSALLQKSSDLFTNTRVSNQVSIQVGVSFGVNRFTHK